MSRIRSAISIAVRSVAPLLASGCINPDLQVTATSVPSACVGAAIGARSAATVRNTSEEPTRGSVRVRWMLSTDALPSTDDRALAGSGADRLIGVLPASTLVAIDRPNLVVPGDVWLGPQYLILVAVDTGDVEAGIAYAAWPITINQCPARADCDVDYRAVEEYVASAATSSGPRAPALNRERPVFLSDRSTLPRRGITVGGREGTRGLLLRYHADRTFSWGKSLSHCVRDSVDSAASFNDGTLAVATTFIGSGKLATELVAFSTSGALLWRRQVLASPTTCTASCPLATHSVVAVDGSDDTAVVAVGGLTGPVELVRIDRHGNERARRRHAEADLGLGVSPGGPTDIATARVVRPSSDVFVAFRAGVALFDGALGLRWSRELGVGTFFGGFPNQGVEVEMCTSRDLYVATTGVEFFHGQDVLSRFDDAGIESWAINVRTREARGAAPPYTGPTGLLRQDRFGLRCNEQDLPELAFRAGDSSTELLREIRAVTLLHGGAVFRQYAGTYPAGDSFAGAAGIGASVLDFLSLRLGKFVLRRAADVGWAPL